MYFKQILSLFLFCSGIVFLLISCITEKEEFPEVNMAPYKDLADGFKNPPDSVKPWVYWYWISDNISREGVTRDLQTMADLGIGAALIGNIFLPNVERGPVPILSEEWYAITEHAIREGNRLGVDIGLFNGPGWVQSGGPWIDSTISMRYLTWSLKRVSGPGDFTGSLEAPESFFQDVALLAIPVPPDIQMGKSALAISSSLPLKDIQKMTDGNKETACSFPISLMEQDSLSIDLEFEQPITVRSLTLFPKKEPFSVNVEVKTWIDGRLQSLGIFEIDRSNNMVEVGPMTYGPVAVSFPEITSGKFRLVFSGLNQREVWFTDVERGGGIAEIELSKAPRLENFVEKQLGKMHQLPMPMWKDYHWSEQSQYQNTSQTIDPGTVKDISEHIDNTGMVHWKVPEGDWLLMRMGMSPTEVTNAPVPEEALGLDVDKMSKEYTRRHFNSYLGPLIQNISENERQSLKYLVADSYETGSQNWTDGFDSVFRKKYGYDPIPWLPVMAGRIVESPDLSDRFLWDLRRLVADQIGNNYIGGLADVAHENGLKLWVENYGHWGFPGEFLQYGSQADLLAGEFWAEGDLGGIECRAAASAAHTYGKSPVFAEALTAAREHYTRYPAMLRKRGDWSFTQGINHFVLHVYIQQPYEERFPGVNAWFGVEFNRHNTWFPHSKSWIDYIRRNNFLLQQGKYHADVCYFIGEGAPLMTGIKEPPLPTGYSYDYINADVILNRLSVKNGKLVLPDGHSYDLMVLPPLKTMTPELLNKIKELVSNGASILGNPPERSPSLQNYPACDREVKIMAEGIWAGNDGQEVRLTQYGKGNVLRGMSLEEAFQHLRLYPDLELPEDTPVEWIHRTGEEAHIYFLTNRSNSFLKFEASFRINNRQPGLWDAVNGEIRNFPDYTIEESRTHIPLEFNPGESYFIVFSGEVEAVMEGKSFPEPVVKDTVKGTWKVIFNPSLGGPDGPVLFESLTGWTEHSDERIKYYSGLATYRMDFTYEEIPEGKLYLSLGKVHNLAKIRLNGNDRGGVWTSPWQVEITDHIMKGKNKLEIDVVNTWVNRLIGDSRLPEEERITWTAINPYGPDDPLQSSGLMGPVRIVKKP